MSKPQVEILKTISMILAFISVAAILLPGIYVTAGLQKLAFLSEFQLELYIVVAIVIISVLVTLFGSSLTNRDRFLLGGICQIVVGLLATGTYAYYTLVVNILGQFGLLMGCLVLPSFVNGAINISIQRALRKTGRNSVQRNKRQRTSSSDTAES